MSVNTHHPRKKKRKKSFIDQLVYFAIFIGPVMTIPQVYDIWVLDRKDVSTISWTTYLLTSLIWLSYGIIHREKPIIVTQLIWAVLSALIVIGSIL